MVEVFQLDDELPEEFSEVGHDIPDPDDDVAPERLSDSEGVVAEEDDEEDEPA